MKHLIISSIILLFFLCTLEVSAEVSNSKWDGSVEQVESFLDNFLNDPDSRQTIEWYRVVEDDHYYMVRYEFRSKNSFGGYIICDWIFYITKITEKVCIVIDINDSSILYDCEE